MRSSPPRSAAMTPARSRWTHRLPGGQLMLRSRRADLAEQELYALLLVHLALRGLMVQASRQGGCDPDTLSFIHTVRVVRRHLPFHAAFLLTLPFGSPSPAPTHG